MKFKSSHPAQATGATPVISIEVVVIGLGLCACEGYAFFDLINGMRSLSVYLVAHTLIALFTCLWALDRGIRRGKPSRTAMLLAITLTMCGPFGAVGTPLALGIAKMFARSRFAFDEWYAELFPTEQRSEIELLVERIVNGRDRSAEERDVTSFMDIMNHGTLVQKQAVIALQTKYFRPEFAPALRRALYDIVPSIRVQAASAVSLIEDRFLENTMKFRKAVEETPQEPDLWLELARNYDDHAFTGLLSSERERENRSEAMHAYLEADRLRPNHLETITLISRMLVREKRYSEAADWIATHQQGGKRSLILGDWYMECLYNLRRHRELRQWARERLRRIRGGEKMPPQRVMDALLVWGEGDDNHAAA